MSNPLAARGAVLLGVLGLSVACGGAASHAESSVPTVSADAQLPSDLECIDVWVQGETVDLVYAVRTGEDQTEAHHMRSSDGGASWGLAVRIDEGVDRLMGPKQWSGPQIAASGDHLVALWTTDGTGFMGRGPLVSVTSSDAGKTWSPGPSLAPSENRGAQAFPDMVADEAGQFHLVWLGNSPGVRNKSLLYSKSTDHGASWESTSVVDDKVCECCWNRLVLGPDQSLFALYRDHSPRDMGVARLGEPGAAWETLGRAGAFDWQIDGCPHVGGGLLALEFDAEHSIHSMVWTGEAKNPGAHYVRSLDGGYTWEDPVKIGGAGSTHCDITSYRGALGAKPVLGLPILMAWDSVEAEGTLLYTSASLDNGETWSEPKQRNSGAAMSEFPVIIPQLGGFRMMWLETVDQVTALKSVWLSNEEVSNG